MDYTLDGANLPPQGIKGALSGQGEWNADKQQFSLQKMQLTANDSTLDGSAEGRLMLPQQLNLFSLPRTHPHHRCLRPTTIWSLWKGSA